ncbi:hypothetical protein [Aminobacter aminovorans]|uniref:Uncharacterized protein n=1 Tax=Aminobacter aminovorans TaxID=83263 RepID=A0AAC8YMS1_AMIAI|nr:hypothetical protein [Aminobacter aminovorans]AMS41212.1 hypothetical protein AA2016_2284 [Aminobacter aminovorans]MBB3705805.1 hypothetical protein [Aminobacter aminovorans]
MSAAVVTFRVHFKDGHSVDVDAADAKAARAAAELKHAGFVSKVKVLKGGVPK